MATEVDIEVDPRTLILEVKKHPALYDKNTMVSSMLKDCKSEQWHEICENIVDGWLDFSTQDRAHIVRSLQARWKNIRDSYLKDQKAIKRPGKRPRRRPYIFSSILTFLDPHNRTIKDEENSMDITQNFVDTEERNNYESSEEGNMPLKSIKKEYDDKADQESCKSREETPHRSVDSASASARRHPVDEDEYFLLSLLPTFHKLNEDQKFDARMEILSVLKRIRQS